MTIVAYGYGISPGSGGGGVTVVTGMVLKQVDVSRDLELAQNSYTVVLDDQGSGIDVNLVLEDSQFRLIVDNDELFVRSC